MAEHFSFFDAVLQDDGVTYDREYNAQQFTKYFGALVTTGVMKGTGNMLAVSANGSNMITKIDTGIAFVEAKYYENDSFLDLTHDTETLGKDRIDRIVVRMDLSTEARYVKAFIKKGVPSTNPVPPTLVQTASLYEISLAQVKIVGGQTFIATNAITDERGTNVICPWAGSNILPSYDDNALAKHLDDFALHTPYAEAISTDGENYSVTLDGVAYYVDGMAISIKPNKTNSIREVKLSINGLPPKPIAHAILDFPVIGLIKAGGIYTLRYSDDMFILQGDGFGLLDSVTSNSTIYAATANAVKMVNDKFTPENYITATLQNGWTGQVRYFKDAFGIVHISGTLDGTVSSSSIAFSLPIGYRASDVRTLSPVRLGTSDSFGEFMISVSQGAYRGSGKPNAVHLNFSYRAEF